MTTKTKFTITGIGVIAFALGAGFTLKSCSEKTSENSDEDLLYLVDIKDSFENSVVFKDEEGREIDINSSDMSKVLAVVSKEKTKDNEQYKTAIINDNGSIQIGYIDGKYLDNTAMDKLPIDKGYMDDIEVDVVTPQPGAWLRKEKIVDRNTNEAEVLNNNQEVLAPKFEETSKDNSLLWKKVYLVKDGKFKSGYIANDYIIDKELKNTNATRLEVLVDGLKFRTKPNTKEETKIKELYNGEELILVPNIGSVSENNIDWFYVAHKNSETGELEFGYVAATIYINDKEINYLKIKEQEPKQEETIEENEESITLQVDVSNTKVDSLSLRREAGLDGEEMTRIDNGTIVYTYQSCLDDKEEKDGFTWVKIYLDPKTSGYVADKYLKQPQRETETINSEGTVFSFGSEGDIPGIIGIDINNSYNCGQLEELLDNGFKYNDEFPKYSEENVKPGFVIIKVGASGYGGYGKPITPAPSTEGYKGNVKKIINLCENKNIPYGFYYFSQAITKEDADKEIEYMRELVDYGRKNLNRKLPLYIDVENGTDYRVVKNAKKIGKTEQTRVVNYLMNKAREEFDIDVCLYSDKNTLNEVLELSALDEINRTNLWLVDPTPTHSKVLSELSLQEDISMRQTELDMEPENIDVDIMNEDTYRQYTKKIQ